VYKRQDFTGAVPSADSFAVDFVDVTDDSLNQAFGPVAVTLVLRSSPPYAESDLVQIQIVDAFVADVSTDFRIATVRVYFNGPVLDAETTTNWTVTQEGAHVNADTENDITVADAFDQPTLLSLCADIRSNYNAHLVESTVHVNSDPDDSIIVGCASLGLAIAMLNEAQIRYASHRSRRGTHLYTDTINAFTYTHVTQLSTAILVANAFKAVYNDHITDVYPLSFSALYPAPIGPVTDYARYNTADRVFDTEGPYTLFVDLHLTTDSLYAPINIEATVTSEDSGSVTNPANYTGSIQARSAVADAQILSELVDPDASVSFLFDQEIVTVNANSLSVIANDRELVSSSQTRATLLATMWAFNQTVYAYSNHLTGAGHQETDITNVVGYGNYAVLPLASTLTIVNVFKGIFNSHISSAIYHYHKDPNFIYTPDATDLNSLTRLVDTIRRIYLSHNFNLGSHSSPGYKIISAYLYDQLVVGCGMLNGESHILTGSLVAEIEDNGLLSSPGDPVPEYRVISDSFDLSYSFVGLATRPSLASAIPKSGVVLTDDGLSFESDAVEVYFSKPMYQVDLNSTNLSVTGSGVLQKNTEWIGDRAASIEVSNMTTASYNVQAVGLTDEAGNLIY